MQTVIEKLFSRTQVGSRPTPSVRNDLLENLKSSKEYRHAFVEEKIRTQLAIQTKTIREQRGMSRPIFAKLMGKVNSWVFRLEDPNQPPPTIPTLLKEAEAFDVDLEISFRPFSHLLNRLEHLNADSFGVPSFDDETRDNRFEGGTNEEMNALWSFLQHGGSGANGNPLRSQPDPEIAGAKILEMPPRADARGNPNDKIPPQGEKRMRVTRSDRSRRR